MGILPEEFLSDDNRWQEPHKELQADTVRDFWVDLFGIIDKRLIELDSRVKQLEEKLNDSEQHSAEVNSY